MFFLLLMLVTLSVLILNFINIYKLIKERNYNKYIRYLIIPSVISVIAGVLYYVILREDTNNITMVTLLYLYIVTALMNVIVGGICLIKSLVYKDNSYIIENIIFIVLSVIAMPLVAILSILLFAISCIGEKTQSTYN